MKINTKKKLFTKSGSAIIILLISGFFLFNYLNLEYLFLPKGVFCSPIRNPPELNIKILENELKSINPCTRSAAALDIQKVGEPAFPLIDLLLLTATDSDDSVRWRSVAAIGDVIGYNRTNADVETEKKVEDLGISLLKDRVPNVRFNAVYLLGHLKSRRAIEAVMEELKTHDLKRIAYASAHLQSMIQTPRDLDLITQVLEILAPLQNDKIAESEPNIFYTYKHFMEVKAANGEPLKIMDFFEVPFKIEEKQVEEYKTEFKNLNYDWLFNKLK